MATVEGPLPPTEAPPSLPDYLTDPDSVLKDQNVEWRHGRAPDYSKTRQFYEASKHVFSTSIESHTIANDPC